MSKAEDTEDSFLGRWSRRKQQSKVEEPNAQESLPAINTLPEQEPELVAPETEMFEQKVDSESDEKEKVLTDEDMVPIESLNADSDYSPFFSEGVSKQLRNMALKKLFFSGKFAFRDGLDDYDDDFTRFEPLGNTVTSDMKFHQRRKEKARLAKLEEERLEKEKQLAAEESDEHSELLEDPETTEVADQSTSEELIGESVEPSDEVADSDTIAEPADSTAVQENLSEDNGLPQNAPLVATSETNRLENPAHRLNQKKPSGDDSNKPDRENT